MQVKNLGSFSWLKPIFFLLVLMGSFLIAPSQSQAAGIISGTVYNDVNDNLAFNTGIDYAVQGATVELQTNAGVAITTVTTNAAGLYTFPAQAAGNYKVLVKTAPTGYGTVAAEVKTIIVTTTADNPNNHLAIKGTGGSIAGRVFDDQDRNITFGGTDANKANIRVFLKKAGATISTVTTTSTGYVFKNLPNAAYTVEVSTVDLDAEGFALVSTSDGVVDTPKKEITLSAVTSAVTGKNFAATEVNTSGVDGVVVVDMNGDNAYVAGEDVLLPGATVTLYYNDGTTVVPGFAPVTTDAAGKYNIKNIPLWKYKVKVTPPAGYISSGSKDGTTAATKSTIVLDLANSSAPYALYNFYVEGDSTSAIVTGISGSVFGKTAGRFSIGVGPDAGGTQNNTPTTGDALFQGVTVQLYKGATLYLTQTTKSDGSYSFKGLTAGTYTVKINTASIPTNFIFINDSDGKSPAKGNAPLAITRVLAANAPQSNQNFWFGEAKANMTIHPRMNSINNSYPWGGMVNRVPSNGGPGYGTYEIYEEDGVTPILNGGVPLTTTGPIGAILPNGPLIAKLVSGSYPSDLVPSWTTGRLCPYPNNNSVEFLTIAFNGGRNFTGKVFVDTNNNGIFDGDDAPIYGAQIIAYNENSTIQWGVTGSAADGTFNFTQLPPRKAKFVVNSLAYADNGVNGQVVFAGDTDGAATQYIIVDLTAGNKTDQNTWFKPTNTTFYIKGTTWIDTYTNNTLQTTGVNGAADSTLNDVTVELWNAAGTTLLNTQTSNASGVFNFAGLSANTTYQIKASKANLSVITTSGNDSAGGATRTITFGANPGVYPDQQFLFKGPGRIYGNSFNDVNGDQTNNGNANEAWASGQHTYTLLQNRGGTWTQIAFRGNSGSAFDFNALEPGDYRVSSSFSIISQRYPDPGLYGRIDLTIPTAGASFTDANFIELWSSTGDMTGSVYLDSNNNGVIDANDIKLTNLPATTKIELYPTAKFYPTYNTSAQTAAALATPRYSVSVNAAGDFSVTTPSSTNYLVKVAGLPADYVLVNDRDGTSPTDSYLPASLQGVGTIKATMLRPGLANQDFLVKRAVPSLISGRVYYDIDYDNNFVLGDDSGITGQTIELYQGATKIASTSVDSDGGYRFENILNGTYTVKLVPGNIPADMVEAPMSVAAVASRTVTISNATPAFGDRNFWYNKSGEAGIAGQVYVDVNNNGVPDATADFPIAGVTITLKKGASVVKTTTTSSRGAYKFTGIAQDNYTVELSVPTGYSVYKTSAGNTTIPNITVNMASSMMYTGRYFLLAGNSNSTPSTGPGSTSANNSGISGFLYKGSSVTPPTGDRLANVSLSLYNSSDVLMGTAITDSTGKYQFFNLAAGTYKVELDQTPSGLAVRGDVDTGTPLGVISAPVVANSGKVSQNIWFAEISPNGIKGKVTYSGAGSTTAGALDIPIPGLTVELYDAASLTTPVGTATTAADGSYEFLDIATMTYVVQVKTADKTANGYRDLNPAAPGRLTITNLSVAGVTGQNFILGGTYSFSGKIEKDTTGDRVVDTSIPNVDTTLIWAGPNGTFGDTDDVKFGSVAVVGSNTVLAGKTDVNGQYTYLNLPNGKYKVGYTDTAATFTGLALIPTTMIAGNTVQPRELTVASANITTANFAYETLANLEGRVVFDSNGNGSYDTADFGIAGVPLTIYRKNGANYDLLPLTATTNATGNYTFTGVPYGDYRVVVNTTTLTTLSPVFDKDGTADSKIELTFSSTVAEQSNWHFGYNGKAGSSKSVTVKTRLDSNSNAAYDATDAGQPTTQVIIAGPFVNGTITTNGSGDYNFPKLPYGDYTFTTQTITGLQSVYDNDGTPFNKITNLAINGSSADPAFGYRADISGGTFTISGNVLFDVNGNAAYDATDWGLSGVKLTLEKKVGTVFAPVASFTAGTPTSGAYSFTGLNAGEYRVTVDPTTISAGLIPAYGVDASHQKTKVIAGSETNWYLGYKGDVPGGKARNTKVLTRYDSNLNSAYDASDANAPGISILLTGNGFNQTIITNGSGEYTFNTLPYGTYTMTATTPTGFNAVYDFDGAPLGAVTFVVANNTLEPYFGYVASGSGGGSGKKLSGRIVLDTNGNGAYDASDLGIKDVQVILEQEVSAGVFAAISPVLTTDATGTYTKLDLPTTNKYRTRVVTSTLPANLTAVFDKDGVGTPHVITGTTTLTADQTDWHYGYKGAAGFAKDITVKTYTDTGTIVGAYDSGDSSLGAVGFNVVSTYFNGSGLATNASGEYILKDLPYGAYTLNATTPSGLNVVYDSDSLTALGRVDMTVGAATPAVGPYFGYDVNLSGGNRILSGEVVLDITNLGAKDPSDIRLSGVKLKLYKETSAGVFTLTSKTATTAANGSYSFTGLVSHATLQYKVEIDTTSLPANLLVSFDKDGIGGIKDHNIIGVVNTTDVTDWDFGYKGDKAGGFAKDVTVKTHFDDNGSYQSSDAIQANVTVTLTGTGISTPTVISTGAAGSFTFVGLPYGTYTLTATTPSGMKVVYNSASNTTNAVVASVNAAYPATPEYFGYQADASGTLSISGRVVLDTNDSGDYTTSDVGLNGAKLTLEMETAPGVFTPVGSSIVTPITASSPGSFTFSNIKAATYRVKVDNTSAPILGLLPVFDKDGIVTAHMATGTITNDETNWNFGYKGDTAGGKAANLTLQTRFDNGNGVYDASDIAEVNVAMQITGNGINHTLTTDSTTGNYVLKNFPHGTYTVAATTPAGLAVAYHPNGTGALSSVSYVVAGATSIASYGYKVDMSTGGTILSGRAVLDVDGNNQQDASDFGIKDVELKVERETSTGVFHQIFFAVTPKTDATGKYTLTNMPNGTYRVSVVQSTVPTNLTAVFTKDNTISSTQIIESTFNGPETNWHFGYKGAGGQSSDLNLYSLFDQDGSESYTGADTPWGTVTVNITSSLINGSVTTNAAGLHTLKNLPYGTYGLTAVLPTGMAIAYDPNATALATVNYAFASSTDVARYGLKANLAGGTFKIEGRVVLDGEPQGSYQATDAGIQTISVVLEKDVALNGNYVLIPQTVTTSSTGAYSFTGLPNGKYRVSVVNMATNLNPIFIKTSTTSTAQRIEESITGTVTDWHFGYSGNVTLDGYVTFDVDNNGQRTVADKVTVGATVKAVHSTLGTFTTTTDATGKYTFLGLTSGDWTISVDKAASALTDYTDRYAGTTPNVGSITVTASGSGIVTPTNRDIGLLGQGIIEGNVVIDENGNGLYNTEDVRPVQARVQITKIGDSTFATINANTDLSGHFRVEHLTPGYEYNVEVLPPLGRAVTYVTPSFVHKGIVGAPGGSLATTHTRFAVTLPTPITNYSDYMVGFKSNLSLSGKVSLDVDASQTKTTSDVGIAGMTVKLTYQDSSITPFTVTTDADGNYIANGIAPGIWTVSMDSAPPTGTTESYEGTRITGFLGYQTITVVATLIANVDFGYYGNAKTSGIIKLDRNSNATDDAPDIALAGVTVTLKDPNSSNFTRQTTTDSAGAYSFEHISNWNPSGDDYVVSVNFATDPILQPYSLSYGAASNILNLTDHSTNKTIPTIGAKGSLTIEGYVHHDVNDDGLYGAAEIKTDFASRTIQLFDNSNNLIKTVMTDANDHYVLEDVGPGTWKVVVSPADVTALRALGYKPSYDYDDLYTSRVVTANTAVVQMTSTNVNAVNFGYVWGGKIETVAKIASGATYNPADPGIPNAKITLQTAGGTDIETRLTDSSGMVIFRNLDPSVDYKLVAKYGINQLGETLAPVLFAYAGVYGVNDDPLTGIVTIDAPLSDISKAADNELVQTQAYFGFNLNNQEVTILKVARKDKATIGEFVPYIIEITNNNATDEVLDATIRDMIPAGFKYVVGSGRFTDVNKVVTKIEPVGTRPIEFKHIDIPAGKKVRITYLLVVGAGVTPGEYVNKAQSINQFGFANSNISSATVKVVGDPLFDDSLIFGKVFHDKNRNGRQDKDESGVPGVKLVTARGEIITTDEHGRYHLADVSGGRWERGTNFILKLDTRSLPQGLTTTTENPIVVRLSPGLPSRINFGVEVPPPIAARLMEQLTLEKSAEVKRIEEELKTVEKFVVESVHFAFDADRIEPEFENTLDSLAEVLKLHPEWRIAIEGHTDSIGSPTYNKDLSQRRADAVKSYLLGVGVNPSQLVSATGFGSEQPVGDNSTAEGRHKNRRVEFLLVK